MVSFGIEYKGIIIGPYFEPSEEDYKSVKIVIDGKEYTRTPVITKDGSLGFVWVDCDGKYYDIYGWAIPKPMGKEVYDDMIIDKETLRDLGERIKRANAEWMEFIEDLDVYMGDELIDFEGEVPVLDDEELEKYITFIKSRARMIMNKIREIEEKYNVIRL